MSRSVPVGPVEMAFADYFADFGITLPDAARGPRADGTLLAVGWSIRWRWRGEALEFRAVHRMTNERWVLIEPDGTLTEPRNVPAELFVLPEGAADQARARAENRAEWAAHGQAVVEAGMEFDAADPPESGTQGVELAWRLENDSQWHSSPFTPRL